MRLAIADIDDYAVTPADLSEIDFEGSPGTVGLTVNGQRRDVARTVEATLDRPTGSLSGDGWFDLSGALEAPCDARVDWDAGTAFLHVVAYHYCTVDQVLDYGDEQRKSPRELGRDERDAFDARAVAERVCDDLCGRTFRATYREEPWFGEDAVQLDFPASRVLSDHFEPLGDGMVRRSDSARYTCPAPLPGGAIRYIAGRDYGVPADVRRAVAKLAASYLMVSRVPDRAVYESTDAGMTRYTLADAESTGIPDVDAIFRRHARKRWVVL